MKKIYSDWIDSNIRDDGFGQCSSATERMSKMFPELTRIRGHYHCPMWGKRMHWWLITKSGEIIDPTAFQFPSKGMGEYEPWIEGTQEPTGKCPNCGAYCYDDNALCSAECEKAYISYLNSSI